MHASSIDLPGDSREKVIQLLNGSLASALDLYLQTKHAHWNVKGPHFIQYHELFDAVAAEVLSAVDELAERAVQLGGAAHGLSAAVVKNSSAPAYPDAHEGRQHVAAVASSVAAVANQARKNIDSSAALGDAVTADLFTGVARALDKQLWFLEAHLQVKA